MIEKRNEPLFGELMDFLKQHAEMNGARLLGYLISQEGHLFHCAKLARLVFPPDWERIELLEAQADLLQGETDGHGTMEQGNTVSLRDPGNPQLMTPKSLDGYDLADLITCRAIANPLTDERTLREISLRREKLKRQIEGNINPEEARAELRALDKYRSHCLIPKGGIKHFDPGPAKTYQALRQSLLRLLRKIPPDQAALAGYIGKNLKSGVTFGWKAGGQGG